MNYKLAKKRYIRGYIESHLRRTGKIPNIKKMTIKFQEFYSFAKKEGYL